MNVTTKQMNEVTALINGMDREQVNSIVDSIKLRRTRLAREATRSFSVGDIVQFTGRGGRDVSGTVVKIKIKNVVVDTGVTKWNVPANMLTAAVMPITL